MDHVSKALELNRGGFNCAQSVLCAFSDVTGLGRDDSLRLAAGLGGGVRSGEVCGAVSGAVLVLFLAAMGTGIAAVGIVALIYGLAGIALIVGIIAAAAQRIQELERGEEEDAKRY